jgi:serine/threonine protein phosphatase PrpC
MSEAIPGPEVGWYTRQGIKPGNPAWVNQDAQLAMQLPGARLLVGVFDGHGEYGHRASGTAKAVISQQATSVLGSVNGGPHAMKHLFAQVQAELQSQQFFQHSGTTATLALIDPVAGSAHVAHVGDSTLALYHGGNLSFMTQDHRIDAAAEQRIRARGGAIQNVGAQQAKRVYMPDNGRGYAVGLSLDRSLGDLDLAQAGVLAEPEVQENLPFQPGTVLIIASDGVWDVVPKAHAAQAVNLQDIEDSAHALVDMARSRWAAGQGQIDDITAVVVKW